MQPRGRRVRSDQHHVAEPEFVQRMINRHREFARRIRLIDFTLLGGLELGPLRKIDSGNERRFLNDFVDLRKHVGFLVLRDRGVAGFNRVGGGGVLRKGTAEAEGQSRHYGESAPCLGNAFRKHGYHCLR